MPQTERGKAFDAQEPELDPEEIYAAKNAGKIAVSFRGKPVLGSPTDIQFIAIKYALVNNDFSVVLLDRFSAGVLLSFLQTVEQTGWKATSMKPGGTQH